jgi:hypothetical protein
MFSRLRHVGSVTAEELHAERSLARVKIEVFTSTLVAAKDAFSGNEFGDENVCAMALADLAKNLVRHPRHRSEVKGEVVTEPRKRCNHRGTVSQNVRERRWIEQSLLDVNQVGNGY